MMINNNIIIPRTINLKKPELWMKSVISYGKVRVDLDGDSGNFIIFCMGFHFLFVMCPHSEHMNCLGCFVYIID